jgi:hypothetical protein
VISTKRNTSSAKKIKNPTTIDELKALRNQVKEAKELKSRRRKEYSKRLRIEQQGGIYTPPTDLANELVLQPRIPPDVDLGPALEFAKDVSKQVFDGED